MTRRRADRRIIYPVLVLVVAAGLAVRARGPRSRRPAPVPEPAPSAPAPVEVRAPLSSMEWQVSTTLARDPFALGPMTESAPSRRRSVGAAAARTTAPSAVAPPALPRVQILLLDPKRPLAIVESRRVAVGDTIGGHRVVAIDARGVTFAWNGSERIARP